MAGRPTPESVGLPRKNFLYTIDQISQLVSVSVPTLRANYLWYHGRSPGRPSKFAIQAHNIKPPGMAGTEWRVEERELVRWMKHMGFTTYDNG